MKVYPFSSTGDQFFDIMGYIAVHITAIKEYPDFQYYLSATKPLI
jgi:hypothetical protein